MPRNSSGTYSLYTPGNPVVTSTVISSTWANNTLADLASALTDSLSRTGDGGMQAPLELVNGAIGAPGATWASETTSGLYRAGAGDFRFSVAAGDVFRFTATGLVAGAATGGQQGAGTINAQGLYINGSSIAGANPTASLGLSAVNGSATTYMRSDAAPALSQSILPTWTAKHTYTSIATEGAVVASSVLPAIGWSETDQGLDAKNWRFAATGGTFVGQTLNDAINAASTWLTVTRSGNTTASVSLGNASDNPSFSFLGTGIFTAGGALRGPVGSAGTPTYSFTGATNYGLYQASSDLWMSLAGTGYLIGYRGMPSRTITTSDNTAATDNGRSVLFTGAGSQTFTLDSDFGVAGYIMTILNGGTGSLAIAESLSGTMTWLNGSGALSTGSRTLAIGGIATIWMVDANNAYIWGTGVT